MIPLTSGQKEQHEKASVYHICECGPFDNNKMATKKVYDHSHLTGHYRGLAHNACNLGYQDSRMSAVIFHNLSGYDGHFLIRDVANGFDGRIDLLAINKEKYIPFTKYVENTSISVRFIDSLRFMNSSLDKL